MRDHLTRFTGPQRLLHWLMAICILSMLFIGIGMISTVTPKYLTLIQIHKALGIAILVLALIRLTLRMVYGAPALPSDLPLADRLAAISSEYTFYALMIGMPLIGWGMLSASSHPVILFGSLHLPPILPVNPLLYTFLRRAHYLFALGFFVLILVHFSAMIFHKIVKNDGIFETMAPALATRQTEDSVHGHH
jgi:cytochrome b561